MNRILIVLVVLMLIPAVALCATITVPEQDLDLHPQGWTAGGTLKFKPGSQAELSERGEVISGVLKFNEYLRSVGRGDDIRGLGDDPRPAPSQYIYFKGTSSSVVFDEQGFVVSGTLARSMYIYLTSDREPSIKFKGDTVIVFDKNGNLKSGTLNEDYYLCPLSGNNVLPTTAGFIKFKAGTEVLFDVNAQVVKGTIANDLMVNGIRYPAGTTLQFSESAYPQKI